MGDGPRILDEGLPEGEADGRSDPGNHWGGFPVLARARHGALAERTGCPARRSVVGGGFGAPVSVLVEGP